MIDRRISILRFWLLSAVALLLALFQLDAALYLFAGFSWLPLGLFMPVLSSGCTNCSGTTPSSLQVDIAGIANSNCTGCTSANASWVTDVASTTCSNTPGDPCCFWKKITTTSVDCSGYCTPNATPYPQLFVLLYLSGSNYILQAKFRETENGGTGWMLWQTDLGTSKPDCNAWSSQSIAWNSNTVFVNCCTFGGVGGTCIPCDGTSSTLAVTKL